MVCGSGVPVCNVTGMLTPGTTCGVARVCQSDAGCIGCIEDAGCSTGMACIAGALRCATGEPRCAPTGALALGTPCGASQVCNGTGGCVGCAQGTQCQPADPCRAGIQNCSGDAGITLRSENGRSAGQARS